MKKNFGLSFVLVLFINSYSCKENKAVKDKITNKTFKIEKDSISQFELDIRAFKEAEPYMLEDIPFAKEYMPYSKNANKHTTEAIVILQKKDIPSINKTLVVHLMKGLTFNEYMNFSEEFFDLIQKNKIKDISLLYDIMGSSDSGFKKHFIENKDDERVKLFLDKLLNTKKVPNSMKSYITETYGE